MGVVKSRDRPKTTARWDFVTPLGSVQESLSKANIMAPKAANPPPAANPSEHATDRPVSVSTSLPLTPEEQELAHKLKEQAALESELADRELRAANLRAELAAFERQYLHFVGLRYAELDEWRARLAERLAVDQPGNERAQHAAREARALAEETKTVAGEKSSQPPRAFTATLEMKRLFRDVAKRIHPDLTSDRNDRAKRQGLMAEANRAYQSGDQQRLVKILTEYEHSPEAVAGEGPGLELVRVIRRVSQARSRLAELEAEIQQLRRSDLYQLKLRVEEAEKSGQDILKQMIVKVNEQITQAKRRLKIETERAH